MGQRQTWGELVQLQSGSVGGGPRAAPIGQLQANLGVTITNISKINIININHNNTNIIST